MLPKDGANDCIIVLCSSVPFSPASPLGRVPDLTHVPARAPCNFAVGNGREQGRDLHSRAEQAPLVVRQVLHLLIMERLRSMAIPIFYTNVES